MSSEINSPELESSPQLVGEQQVVLAREWAALYSDPQLDEGERSAEIILRNPAVYLRNVSTAQLPEDLRDSWSKLLGYSDSVADMAATTDRKWAADDSGIEKIQMLVRNGDVSPTYRGAVADIMINSSDLFAESTKHAPGNTKYFAGNVRGASGWLQKIKQPSPS